MRLPTVYVRGNGHVLAEVDQRWRQPGDENHTDIPRMYDVLNEPYLRPNLQMQMITELKMLHSLGLVV